MGGWGDGSCDDALARHVPGRAGGQWEAGGRGTAQQPCRLAAASCRRRRTRRSPSPIHLETREEAEMEKKTAEMLVAMACGHSKIKGWVGGRSGLQDRQKGVGEGWRCRQGSLG